MEILEVMKSRHSVRQYTDKIIESDKRSILNELAHECNSESGMNIQIIYDEPKCFDSFMAHYGKFQAVRIILLLWVRRVNRYLMYAVRLMEYRHELH